MNTITSVAYLCDPSFIPVYVNLHAVIQLCSCMQKYHNNTDDFKIDFSCIKQI
jgi:hypothetical protein